MRSDVIRELPAPPTFGLWRSGTSFALAQAREAIQRHHRHHGHIQNIKHVLAELYIRFDQPGLALPINQCVVVGMVRSHPRAITAGSVRDEILTNLDFAPTLLDFAGIDIPDEMQGVSGQTMLEGNAPADWQQSFYYRYWDHGGHNVCAHYGVRNHRYKLIYFYTPKQTMWGDVTTPDIPPYWELFDLEADPNELKNVYNDPAYADVQRQLHSELDRLQSHYGDEPLHR